MPRHNSVVDRAVQVEDVANNRARTSVKGYHYLLGGRSPILCSFGAVVDPNVHDMLPTIDVASKFLNLNNAPIYSTIVSVDHRHFLVVGYFDILAPQNLNVKEVFPYLPWYGELAVFSLGKRVCLLSRPAASRYVIRKAISSYIQAAMELRITGFEACAPFQVTGGGFMM